MSKKTIIALTGGIGSGKTTVAKIFSLLDIPVYNADEKSKRLVDTESEIIRNLKDLFSEEIYINSTLNKKMLADHIFNNEDLLKQVNNIIHPQVKKDFIHWVGLQDSQFVLIETAILFESKFNEIVDLIISINSPIEDRIQRCVNRDHISREAIEARIKNQISDKVRNEASDYIIINDNQHSVIEQVHQILKQIKDKSTIKN